MLLTSSVASKGSRRGLCLPQAGFFDEYGVNFARAMHATDQDLLDVGGAAGTGDEHDRPPRGLRVCDARQGKLFQNLLQGSDDLSTKVKSNVDRRCKRRELATFGGTAQY